MSEANSVATCLKQTTISCGRDQKRGERVKGGKQQIAIASYKSDYDRKAAAEGEDDELGYQMLPGVARSGVDTSIQMVPDVTAVNLK